MPKIRIIDEKLRLWNDNDIVDKVLVDKKDHDDDIIDFMIGLTGAIYNLSQKHSSIDIKAIVPIWICELSRLLKHYKR